MTVTRLPDWRPRLVAYLEDVRCRPFAYGQHDCALFAAGAIQAMTGTDLAADYRGRYNGLEQGLRLVGTSHLQILRQHFEPIPASFAGVGDIALMGEPGFPALGIFEGEHVLVLRDDGLGRMPRAEVTEAFRVP